MATWEDGPEYAPLERPDAFADPSVATVGLAAPPPAPVPPPAPTERPAFADPGQPVPPLAALVPAPPARRDPNVPFDVAASLMTAETSAWASSHFPTAPAGPTATGQHPSDHPTLHPSPDNAIRPASYGAGDVRDWRATDEPGRGERSAAHRSAHGRPPTTGPGLDSGCLGRTLTRLPATRRRARLPGPELPATDVPAAGLPSRRLSAGPGDRGGRGVRSSQPAVPAPGQVPANGPFAAPGTPQWFGPGDYQQPPPPPPAPTARTVLAAVTPGVLLTLVVGGFIWVLAPVTMVVAFVLSGRMRYGRKVTRTAFAAVLAFLGLVGLLSLITADGSFSQWWDTVAGWACFGSWVMIVASTIAAYRALKQGRPDPPPTARVSIR